MTALDVVRDPLGQLNLALWMAQPVPPEFPIRPVLREAGYRLLYLAPPMPLLPGIRDRLQAAEIPYVAAPEPDVLLSAEQGQAYLRPGGPGRRITVQSEVGREAAIDAFTERSRKACPRIDLRQPTLPFEDQE